MVGGMMRGKWAVGAVIAASSTALLWAVAPSDAASVTTPCGDERIDALTVSGDYWFISCFTSPTMTFFLSRDAGSTWQTVTGFPAASPGAYDGSFYHYYRSWTGGFKMHRLDAAAAAVTDVKITGPDPEAGSWATDSERGVMWASSCTASNTLNLIRVDIASATSSLVAAGGSCSDAYQKPLRLNAAGQPYVLASPTTRWIVQGSALVQAPLPTIGESGSSRVTEGGITSGGFTNTQEFSPVPGHPDVLVDQSSGFLFPRVGEGIWAYTGRPFLASSSQGVVVTTDWRRNRIQVIAGPLADALKPQGDPQPPDSAAMIDETNRMRSEANLPSLVGDARLAAAAHNHAVYMQLNQYLDHNEDSGKPGFTGGEPWERCVAVGFPFQCGEIANYAGDFGSRMSVQVWIATAFHRDMLTSPGVGPIGGGFVTPGGWSVMNAPSDSRHYLGDAIGYPRGTYTGPLWYSGEIPDPAASCADGSISAPYGTAISLNLPDNGLKWPDSITLRDGVGTTVRGCLLREDHGSSAAVFQPDDPLKPWTTYSVTASWTGRRDDLTWTFATTAGPAGLDTVPPGTKNPSRRSRAKHFKVILKPRSERRLRIDVNPDLGKKTYRGALQKGRKSHWRTVKRVRLSGKRHVRIIHARRPGAYRIVIPGQHGYKKGASRIVRLK